MYVVVTVNCMNDVAVCAVMVLLSLSSFLAALYFESHLNLFLMYTSCDSFFAS